MRNKRSNNVMNRLVQIVLLGVILFSTYKLGESVIQGIRARQVYDALWEQVRLEADEVSNRVIEIKKKEPKLYPPLEMDLDMLEKMNSDFVGWIYYPGLEVNYPVVQAEDNEYYVHKSFEGKKLYAGCIFLDCGASSDFSDRNTFIFGHNMRDGSMFGSLSDLLSDDTIMKTYPYFYIYTQKEVYTYEIFSYYQVKANSDRYRTFSKDETYDEYVKWAIENSEGQKEMDLSARSNIVTLSTCHGATGSNKRFLVHGVLIRTEDY